MIRFFCGFLALIAVSGATPVYLTIVMHNEEPGRRQPQYLDRDFYLRNRELLRRFAVTVKNGGAMLNLQSDWNFLQAVGEFDRGSVTANTGGKNILRWMVEDLGFEADPHAHETKYNYADVAHLHSQLGVKPSGTVGGFLYLPPDNPQGWEQHERGVRGRVYPDAFWKADLLWGAGTANHQGDDERVYGMWKPKDRHNFYEHDPSRRLSYIAGNCYSWTGMPPGRVLEIRELIRAIERGQAPADGFYTANIFVPQGRLDDALIEQAAADLKALAPLAKAGKIVWSKLSATAERWRTDYGAKPFHYAYVGGAQQGAASAPRALDQRRREGAANVYVNFAINCHDWLDPDMSARAVLRAARLFAQHKLRADFYVTEPLARAWVEKVPGTVEELKKLGMAFGYHHRPPHPIWFDSAERRRMLTETPEEAYGELEAYEAWRLDLNTGGLDKRATGGYTGTTELLGAKPPALGASAAAPNLVAWDREILARLGARMVVAWHSAGNAEYPLMWWQGMLARPSDFSVVRVPPNSKQRALGIQPLPRGVAAGEEAGNFWWNVTEDPEAQEHAPGKYLLRRMGDLPKDRITFITCLIHEDNWYKQGTSWDGTYFEDRGRKQPRTPPYKPEPRRMVRLRSQDEQERIWRWWEELVETAGRDERVRVVTTNDLLGMLRPDDLERTYDHAAVMAAARQVAAAGARLPEFVVVGEDALSLGDCVQVFTRALAGERVLATRTMLGPSSSAVPQGGREVAPADLIAAAKGLVARLQRRGKPDALPGAVKVGEREVALEAYLYASARVLSGEKRPFEIAEIKPVPDPARWTVKPARRR